MKAFVKALIAVVIAVVLLEMLYGCSGDAPKAGPQLPPEPSSIVRQFRLGLLEAGRVTEFRDSAGRICVYIYANRGSVLDCGRPLPPLEYEHLEQLGPAP